MKIILTESQYNFLIESINVDPENLKFIENFYEKEGFLPTYTVLQNMKNKIVSDYYPEHPKANIKLKTFVNLYLKDFKNIINVLEKKYNLLPQSPSGRNKIYLSNDGKHRFKSLFETIFYNIFVEYNLANELTYESREFLKDCGKIPDFKWENKKLLIEIGGMESEEYWKKLNGSEDCFKKYGYDTIIINARDLQKQHSYTKFYELVCNLFGFSLREDILKNPMIIINYRNIDEKFMNEFIDTNIENFDRKRGETDMLIKFLKHFGYNGINDYKKKMGLKRFENSVSLDDVVDLVNQKMTYNDICKTLNISRTGLDKKIKHAKELGKLPDTNINRDLRDVQRKKVEERPSIKQLEKDLEKLGSYNKVGQKYGVSHAAIKKWINK